MRHVLLATGLLALVARVTVLAHGGTAGNLIALAVFIVAAMGYIAISITD